jgi:hypothetical protein
MIIGKLRPKQKVFAYLRTSSAANTGEDKDSDTRQLEAIKRYAENNHCAVAATFYLITHASPLVRHNCLVGLRKA